MMKNKRGDIPITILVLGTFILCSLALLSFFASNSIVGNSFEVVDLMEKMNSKVNEYDFYNFEGFSEKVIEEEILKEDGFYVEENYFLIDATNEGWWFWEEDEFLFSVKYFRN